MPIKHVAPIHWMACHYGSEAEHHVATRYGIDARITLDNDWPEDMKPHYSILIRDRRFGAKERRGGVGGGSRDSALARAKVLANEWLLEAVAKKRAASPRKRPITGKRRDNQKSKLYRAEAVLDQFTKPLPSVKDVERFVKKVWASKRVQLAFPRAIVRNSEPRVKDGRGTRTATGWSSGISIPLWARNERIVLHELAHTIVSRTHNGVAGHGWEYADTFLKLVLYMLGREAHDALKASMKKHRVRFKPKRQRAPMSFEQRTRLLDTLAIARARKNGAGGVPPTPPCAD